MFQNLQESARPKITRIGAVTLACLIGSLIFRGVDAFGRPPHAHGLWVVPQLLSMALLLVACVLMFQQQRVRRKRSAAQESA